MSLNKYMGEMLEDFIAFGSLTGGIWALSLLGLKSIHGTAEAEERLRDAAAAAIVALNLIAGGAAAAFLGSRMWPEEDTGETSFEFIGAGIAVAIFLIPFAAMLVVYKGWFRKKDPAAGSASTAPTDAGAVGQGATPGSATVQEAEESSSALAGSHSSAQSR